MAAGRVSGAWMYFITFLKDRAGLVAFILAVIYFLFIIRSDMVQNHQLKEEKSALERSFSEEQTRYDLLKGKMARSSSSYFIEMTAREKLGLVTKGESAYKVIYK